MAPLNFTCFPIFVAYNQQKPTKHFAFVVDYTVWLQSKGVDQGGDAWFGGVERTRRLANIHHIMSLINERELSRTTYR